MRAALLLALVACTKLNIGAAPPDASSDRVCVTGSATDNANCGACGNACQLGRTCQSGRCTADACVSGRANCDGVEGNGCEVSLATDTRHCGRCDVVCELAHASVACIAGACRVDRCDETFGDCDGAPANGCERALSTSVAHCGACGAACATPHATPACVAGACAISACNTGFADCDGDAANGCEADLGASVAHCGACGGSCPAPVHGVATCIRGACGSECDAGFERSTGACLPPGAPRLMAPLSASAVTTRRPTLRWTLGVGSDGAMVEVCHDRAMTDCQRHPVTGSELRLPSALSQGVWFWRARGRVGAMTLSATSLTWSFLVGARDAPVEGWTPMPLDLDRDGFDDVAIGATRADVDTIMNAGSVSVFRGSASGPRAMPSRVLAGAATNDAFGTSVASAGDVNGDGFVDLLVSAPFAPDSSFRRPGAVSVFHGGATGVGVGAARVLEGREASFGFVVASAGDVNGDGYSDVAVVGPVRSLGGYAVSVYHGGATGLAAIPARVVAEGGAWAVSGASDLNRDGFADVLVGAPHTHPGGRMDAGAASVYFGSATGLAATPARVFHGDAPGDQMGYSVANLGDVNGDGFEDLVVGAPGAAPGGRVRAGSVRVYLNGPSGVGAVTPRAIDGDAPGDEAGARVARIGDVNGDGYADLAVGAPGANGARGRVSVFPGGPTGTGATAARVIEGDAPGASFGRVIEGLGDVNGDGYADLAVGAPGATIGGQEGVGRVSLYFGSATGLGALPTYVFEGRARNDFFGEAVGH